MTNDPELATDEGLLDLGSLRVADVLLSGDTALVHALRRLATDLGDPAATPILAGFSNFAPPEPDLA